MAAQTGNSYIVGTPINSIEISTANRCNYYVRGIFYHQKFTIFPEI